MSDRPLTAPWPPKPAGDDPFGDFERDQLMVFVPAIMSVGLIFSITTLVRDALLRTGARTRARRVTVETTLTLNDLLGNEAAADPAHGVLHRRAYASMAGVLMFGSATLLAVAGFSYGQQGGPVEAQGWVLAAAVVASGLAAMVGVAAAAIWRRWPSMPGWTVPLARFVPLVWEPHRAGRGPSWRLSVSVATAMFATALLTALVHGATALTAKLDEPLHDWITSVELIERVDTLDLYGSTVISIGFFALIGLSGFRCRVMALTFPAVFVVSWVTTFILREIVARPRPPGFGDLASYPSGHLVQAVLIAGLLPTAVAVLLRSPRWLIWSLRCLLGVFVVWTAAVRTFDENHWPLDTAGGALVGITVVLAGHWVLEHRGWHQRCNGCPWSEHPDVAPWSRGVFDLTPGEARVLRWAGPASAIAAAGALMVGAFVIGLPRAPAGEGLQRIYAAPIEVGLAVVMAVAGIIAFRFKAVGAFLMALAATGIGLLASVQYTPPATVALAATLLIPAVMTWLAWQPHETIGSISALALITATSLTSIGFASREVHGHFFGPTHPGSVAAELESEADWLWLGGVTTDAATVVAGGFDDGETVELRYWRGEPGRDARIVRAEADRFGIARVELTDLNPGGTYSYAVDDDEPDATFRTFAEGPQDVAIVVGSCARTGSNAAVFDRMVEQDADLFIELGDLFYGDLESRDPADHLNLYGLTLGQPAQSALFRSTPTAYVWDDHDFGPNDADRSSPSRLAVSEAYRRGVPHYGVDPDVEAPIAQAFTIGRVRVVMTDSRSQRTAETMLGADQIDWLLDELVASAESHAVVIWANPVPWISDAPPGGDDWSGYPEERRRIADAIAAAGIDNLVMVSGDAHMAALDDGTNSDYSTDGGAGFPVLQAAPLDRPSSVKGGPYSHGVFAESGQFGMIRIADDGGASVTVTLSAHNWRNEELVRHEVVVDVPATAG